MEDYKSFRSSILSPRSQGKARNSWGVYDAYKHIRKHGWYDIGRPVTEHEFYSIVREVNQLLAHEASQGRTIIFPSRMGALELRKRQAGAVYDHGKLRVSYPVDWDATLRLWFQDPEAKESKLLIRTEDPMVYHIKYCKSKANYENKSLYDFIVNRAIKKALKEHIKAGTVDSLYEE